LSSRAQVSLDDKEKIKEFMKDKTLRAGKLARLGVHVINADVLMEVHRRASELLAEEAAEKKKDKKLVSLTKDEAAVFYHKESKRKGKPTDKNDKIKLAHMAANTIVKSLMPRLDSTKKASDYTTIKKCIKWLMTLEDWESKMEELNKDTLKGRKETHGRLFYLQMT